MRKRMKDEEDVRGGQMERESGLGGGAERGRALKTPR